MITVTVGDVLQQVLPDGYFNSVHCVYIVRDGARILYVGKAERQSTHARLLQHLAATLDGDYRGIDLTPSELGRMIQSHTPESLRWEIDLLTLSDCQAIAGPGRGRPATVEQAERFLIKLYAPLLNQVNNVQPAVRPNTEQTRAGRERALPCFADEYLSAVSDNRKTQDTYRYALLRFQRFAESSSLTAPATPLEPTRLHLNALVDFVTWMHQGGAKNNTVRTFVAVVRQYLLWLQGNDLLSPDLRVAEMELALEKLAGPHLRNIPHEHRHADSALGQLMNYFNSLPKSPFPNTPRGRRQKLTCLRNRAIVQTLYSTAGRASEVATLPRNAFDEIQQALSIATLGSNGQQPVPVDVVGRNGKSRPIFLTAEAVEAIRTYLIARDASDLCKDSNAEPGRIVPLFVRHDRYGASAISAKTVWQIVNDAAKKVFGTDKNGRPLKRLGPNDFRHLRAQNLFDDGMPLDTLQAMLGHSSLLTTRRAYGDFPARDRLADEIARFGRSSSDVASRK